VNDHLMRGEPLIITAEGARMIHMIDLGVQSAKLGRTLPAKYGEWRQLSARPHRPLSRTPGEGWGEVLRSRRGKGKRRTKTKTLTLALSRRTGRGC
jgi:hypothetical protein